MKRVRSEHEVVQSYVQNQVDEAVDMLRSRIEGLADQWRTDVLLPFCRKHRLTYLSGNGVTAFYQGRR